MAGATWHPAGRTVPADSRDVAAVHDRRPGPIRASAPRTRRMATTANRTNQGHPMRPVRGRFLANVRPAGYRVGPLRSGAVSPPSRLHPMLVAPCPRDRRWCVPVQAWRADAALFVSARPARPGRPDSDEPCPTTGEKAARADDPSAAADARATSIVYARTLTGQGDNRWCDDHGWRERSGLVGIGESCLEKSA
jgi:hypothetical protein